MKLKLGSKVALLDKFYGHIKEIYHVIRINKYTYTLNDKSLIDKETLREKRRWSERQYVIPTDEMIMVNIHWAFGIALFIYVYELFDTIFHYKGEIK